MPSSCSPSSSSLAGGGTFTRVSSTTTVEVRFFPAALNLRTWWRRTSASTTSFGHSGRKWGILTFCAMGRPVLQAALSHLQQHPRTKRPHLKTRRTNQTSGASTQRWKPTTIWVTNTLCFTTWASTIAPSVGIPSTCCPLLSTSEKEPVIKYSTSSCQFSVSTKSEWKKP